MEIRLFEKSDTNRVAQLFRENILIANNKQYTETRLYLKDPQSIPFLNWEESCLQTFTIVAEINNAIVGIAQLNDDGHLNCLYCHPDYRREGIGGQLYFAVEEYAVSKGLSMIYTEANIKDHSFFTEMGFESVHKQQVAIYGEILTNYVIQKKI